MHTFKHEITPKEWLLGSSIVTFIVWVHMLFPRYSSAEGMLTIMTIPYKWSAVFPRNIESLPGILTMHFMHVSVEHLASNLGLLIVFMIILAKISMRSWQILLSIALLSGTLIWSLHPAESKNVNIVGASAVVFGLVGYIAPCLVFNKEFWEAIRSRGQKNVKKLLFVNFWISFVGSSVLMAYWDLIVDGLGLGVSESRTSLVAHLYGLIAGFIVYFLELIYVIRRLRNAQKIRAQAKRLRNKRAQSKSSSSDNPFADVLAANGTTQEELRDA